MWLIIDGVLAPLTDISNHQLQLWAAHLSYGLMFRWNQLGMRPGAAGPAGGRLCVKKSREQREALGVGGASTEVSTLRLALCRNSPKVIGRHPAAILEENSNHLFASFKAREPAGFLRKNCYNHREFRWYPCRLKLSTTQKQGESCGILDIVEFFDCFMYLHR